MKLPSSAPSPFRGSLLSSPGVVPLERLSVSPRIPSSPFSFHPQLPQTPRGSQSFRCPPRYPSLGVVGGQPHPSPPSPVSPAEAQQAGVRLRRGAGHGAPSGQRVSPSKHQESAELGCSTNIRFGLAPSATTSEPQALPVYTAAAPEISELQPLQPIPAQPQPARDMPSCIIHETASFLRHPEALACVPYTRSPTH